MIHRITNNITLIYDGDAAGIKAAIRGVDLLLEEGMNIKIVLLPDGEDPDSFARKHNAFEFSVYLQKHETDFIRFKTKLLLNEAGDDPIKRAKLISEIIHSIAVIPDNIVRSVYVKECSDLLDIKEQTLLNELNKIRANKRNTPTQAKAALVTQTEAIPQNEWIDHSAPLPETTGTNAPQHNTPGVKHPPKNFISPFKAYEEALLLYVIQYGERTLFEYVEDNETIIIKVPEYIHSELENDDLAFLTPHYKHILDEAISQCHEDNFIAARHFLSHTNPSVSQTAINLAGTNHKQFFEEAELEEVNAEIEETTDKKQLVKLQNIKEQILQKQMEEFEHALRRDIFAFKEAYVIQQINAIHKKMKELQTNGDVEEAIKLMAELQRLNEIKVILSKELGERIILKM